MTDEEILAALLELNLERSASNEHIAAEAGGDAEPDEGDQAGQN